VSLDGLLADVVASLIVLAGLVFGLGFAAGWWVRKR